MKNNSFLFIGFLLCSTSLFGQIVHSGSFKLKNKMAVASEVNPNADMVAIGCSDNSIELFQLPSLAPIKTLNGHKSQIKCLVFIEKYNLLASASADNSINLWDYTSGELISTLTGHQKAINEIVFSAKKDMIISASQDETVKFWDLKDKKLSKSLYLGHKGINHLALMEDETFVVASTVEKTIASISLSSFTLVKEINFHGGIIAEMSLTDGDKSVLLASGENSLSSVDIVTGAKKEVATSKKLLMKVYNPLDTIAFFVANGDKTFSIWKFGANEPTFTSGKLSDQIVSISLAKNSLVVCDFSNTVTIWDVASLNLVPRKKSNTFKKAIAKDVAPKVAVPEKTTAEVAANLAAMPKMYAVVVGVSEYQDPKMNLRFADDDAESYYEFLTSPNGGNISKENITLLVNQKATRSSIIKEVTNQMRKALDNDMVIVYMACHGMPNMDASEIYLLASDTERDNIEGTGVSYSEIKKIIYNCRADKKLLIMDACHSGGAGVDEGGARGNLSDAHASMTNRLLTNVSSQGKSVMILNSSSAAQPSKESEQWGGGHGVFSYYLLKGLKGDADENGNGIVDIRELYEYIRSTVSKDTENKQWPELKGTFNDRFPLSVIRGR